MVVGIHFVIAITLAAISVAIANYLAVGSPRLWAGASSAWADWSAVIALPVAILASGLFIPLFYENARMYFSLVAIVAILPSMLALSLRLAFERNAIGSVLICAQILCLLTIGIINIFVSHPLHTARRLQCRDNLRRIGEAVLAESGSRLPLILHPDKASDVTEISWRVRLLPFLGHANLYHRYDKSVPWNSTENDYISRNIPRDYICPEASSHLDPEGRGLTSYLRGMPGPVQSVESDENHRQKSPRVMNNEVVVEICAARVVWTAPDDLTEKQKGVDLLQNTPGSMSMHPSYSSVLFTGYRPALVNVLLADGRVVTVRRDCLDLIGR